MKTANMSWCSLPLLLLYLRTISQGQSQVIHGEAQADAENDMVY